MIVINFIITMFVLPIFLSVLPWAIFHNSLFSETLFFKNVNKGTDIVMGCFCWGFITGIFLVPYLFITVFAPYFK